MILVSGFKPFLNESINPSQMLVESIQNEQVSKVILPVEFERAFLVLREQIEQIKPKMVIMLGQAGGRFKVSLEKVALNWRQTESADESGCLPKPGKIDPVNSLALMTQFPVDDLLSELLKVDIPVELSFSAGTFVCNDLYYKVLKQYPNIPSVFIHVPYIKEQNHLDQPSMNFETLVKMINIIINFLK